MKVTSLAYLVVQALIFVSFGCASLPRLTSDELEMSEIELTVDGGYIPIWARVEIARGHVRIEHIDGSSKSIRLTGNDAEELIQFLEPGALSLAMTQYDDEEARGYYDTGTIDISVDQGPVRRLILDAPVRVSPPPIVGEFLLALDRFLLMKATRFYCSSQFCKEGYFNLVVDSWKD